MSGSDGTSAGPAGKIERMTGSTIGGIGMYS